ncbi:hypothetical protein Salat_2697800 [Sesamum alatum]|uniref:Uncharacterized protein n=1 Tax=Sesamum alatum TaxID=300844 RepID=A0AAE1XQR4_9LAMI|nr:hypothetical protein Salat_2697800 [Sesamum alatum]
MSLENEDQRSPDKGSTVFDVVLKKPKITYPREFMLSLSNLDICKKLPSGFDESLLCEFEDALQSTQDLPRNPGGLPLQGFRRNEHGSSPPTRGDSGNYSRGIYGKWESRSSGRSDRDSDSQSDRDSDSGRRYGHHARRSWQSSEQDGLLGSGSFPRPSGYAGGIAAPKVRANEPYQLSKTNEPYHPPRPYKAVPYSRRDTDAFNDETFGSTECSNEDKAEEERRRRASFEMMRKEQQKALQEKQKLLLEKHKSSDVSELHELLEDKKERKEPFLRNNEFEVSAATPTLGNDSEKSSLGSNSPASRPLVPPGFKNNILEKSSVLRSPIHHPLLEEGKRVTGSDAEVNLVQNGINDGLEQRLSQDISLFDGKPTEKTHHTTLFDKGENVNLRKSTDLPISKPGMVDQLPHASSHSNGTFENPESVELSVVALEDKIVGDSNKKFSTSILGKIFGSTLSINEDGSGAAEHNDSKPDDTWSPNSGKSSKFAQWFFEEEAKPVDDTLSAKPSSLLSLIVSGDKDRYQVSDTEAAEKLPCDFSNKTSKQSSKLTLDMPSAADGVSDQACIDNKQGTVPTVLTCEDLEQSILTEYSAKTTNTLLNGWSTTDRNTEQPSEHVNDHASVHLLSLLQKGTDKSNVTLNSGVDINMFDKPLISEENDMDSVVKEPKGEEHCKNDLNSGKTLTLETLFGSAFMKELQSVGAPVSIQRSSTGSAEVDPGDAHGLPFPVINDDSSTSAIDKVGLQELSRDHRVFASNHGQQIKMSTAENWLGFDGFQIGTTSPKHHPEAVPKHGGLEEAVGFQLPEENIIPVTDPRNHRMSTFVPTHNSVNNNFSSNIPINVMDKLAASSAVKDERFMPGPESLPFIRSPFGNMEPEFPYHNLQAQQSSPEFQPPQLAQVRPSYNQLESHLAHMSSQMKFLGPEPMFSHDFPASHQFPSAMIQHPFHRPSIGGSGFDGPSHHSMLHQMQMSGNRTPHVLADLPRGGPVAHHGNQASGFIQEMNQIQGFPFGALQPNIGSDGFPIPAHDMHSGSNPPEAFQRLIEMELQANSKHIHPFATGHNQGVYGREIDMGFRYR